MWWRNSPFYILIWVLHPVCFIRLRRRTENDWNMMFTLFRLRGFPHVVVELFLLPVAVCELPRLTNYCAGLGPTTGLSIGWALVEHWTVGSPLSSTVAILCILKGRRLKKAACKHSVTKSNGATPRVGIYYLSRYPLKSAPSGLILVRAPVLLWGRPSNQSTRVSLCWRRPRFV